MIRQLLAVCALAFASLAWATEGEPVPVRQVLSEDVVIDWTRMGWSPPKATSPTWTVRVGRLR